MPVSCPGRLFTRGGKGGRRQPEPQSRSGECPCTLHVQAGPPCTSLDENFWHCGQKCLSECLEANTRGRMHTISLGGEPNPGTAGCGVHTFAHAHAGWSQAGRWSCCCCRRCWRSPAPAGPSRLPSAALAILSTCTEESGSCCCCCKAGGCCPCLPPLVPVAPLDLRAGRAGWARRARWVGHLAWHKR